MKATTAATVLLLSTVEGTTPRYIWNASNSVPIGIYRLQPITTLAVTELVAIQPPELLAAFLDLNGYLPIGVPMLNRVLALPGQTVFRNGLAIVVDGIVVGQAREGVEPGGVQLVVFERRQGALGGVDPL